MFKKLLLISAIGLSGIAFSQNTVKEKLSNYLDSLCLHHKVMGSFAFVDKNQAKFVKVVGLSDVEHQQNANMNTQYRIGSISKIFTAVLVMKAVEEKKISLDDKLSGFYPEIPNAQKITIEHMLQHRSGIHNLTDEPEYMQYYTKPHTEADLIGIIKKYNSDFEPGAKFEYSNSNYILLGIILEKIYKTSYAELVSTKIARPLKLTLTKVGGAIDPSKNQAESYEYIEGRYRKMPETDMSIPGGAGNMVSTPVELLEFIIGLEKGKLIKKASLDKMKSFKDGYGYGLIKLTYDKSSGFGHNGGIDGFRSAVYYFPDLKVAASYIVNQSSIDPDDIFDNMMAAATGKDFKIPSFAVIQVPEAELKKLTGNYASPGVPLKINIFIQNKVLMAQATGQSAFPLDAISETSFKYDMAGIVINFHPEKKQFDIIQRGAKTTFTKE
ncbi:MULTISPECIES: serine hydrolase domain-containing protein [Chryseobacterium]|nr:MULTISPECIES: serine hydrolase domain-containing protein [Chryseobacterium]